MSAYASRLERDRRMMLQHRCSMNVVTSAIMQSIIMPGETKAIFKKKKKTQSKCASHLTEVLLEAQLDVLALLLYTCFLLHSIIVDMFSSIHPFSTAFCAGAYNSDLFKS